MGVAPTSVTGSSDDTVLQTISLLNEGLDELGVLSWPPQEASFTFSFTGPLVPPATNDPTLYQFLDLRTGLPDFQGLVHGTFYTSATRIPVDGPITETDWANMVTLQISAAQYAYRIWRFGLYMYPYPAAGVAVSFSFRYMTNYKVIDFTGGGVGQGKPYYTLDTDISVIPSEILLQDLRSRWKREKGFGEDFSLRDKMVANYMNNLGDAGVIDLGDPTASDIERIIGPGLYIAAGNTIPVT